MAASSEMVAPAPRRTARAKPKEADVFVGFMDEEVNDLLRVLRSRFPERPIIVLEREQASRLDVDWLFETPTSFYGDGEKPDLHVLETTDTALPGTYEGDLARSIGKSLDKAKLDKLLMVGKTKTLDPKSEKINRRLLVARFDRDKNVGANPVILLRCPEMGLQPALVQEYLTRILQTIKASVSGDVRLHMFGAGGAIGRHLKPGSKSRIVGSLFLGAELDTSDRTQFFYRPAIKLISMKEEITFRRGGRSFPRFGFKLGDKDGAAAARKKAEATAKRAFHKGAEDLRLVSSDGKTLDQAAKDLIASSGTKDGTISLTVSFFGSAEEKEAGRKIGGVGLSDVNMEDYHVLLAAKAAKIKHDHIRLERVNADPSVIPHEVEDRVRAAAAKMRLKDADYVEALLWGLQGSDTSQAPDAASWARSVFDPTKPHDRDMLLPAERSANKRPLMLNMFYGEIASDFITSLLEARKKKGAFAALRTRYVQQLRAHPKIRREVLREFDDRVVTIRRATGYVTRAAHAGSQRLRELVQKLVELLQYIKFKSGPVAQRCSENAEAGRSNVPLVPGPDGSWCLPILWDPGGRESGTMKVWARSDKVPTVDELRLSAADVDRVLYKGSNRPALKVWAPQFVAQQARLIAAGSLLSRERRQQRVPDSVHRLELVAQDHQRRIEGLHRTPRRAPKGARRRATAIARSHPLFPGSSGDPLTGPARQTLEGHFGRDLSDVVIHTDPAAAAAAQSMGAKAFALENHVFFGQGQYRPETREGLGLLGHEVAHVDQFRKGIAKPQPLARAASSAETFSDAHGAKIQRKPLVLAGGGKSGGGVGGGPISVGVRADGRGGTLIHRLVVQHAGQVQGSESGGPHLELARAKSGEAGAAPDGFDALIDASSGLALPAAIGQRLGGLFGADFSGVRIHTDGIAAAAAKAVRAEAFTIGRHIFFGSGRWDPSSPRGLALIGHELTHVAQNEGGARTLSAKELQRSEDSAPPLRAVAREVKRKDDYTVAGHDAFERQALGNERAILQAMQGAPATRSDQPCFVALRASGVVARRSSGHTISRKETGDRWDRISAWVSQNLEENRKYWDDVGVAGIQRGGVLGYTQAGFAAVFSGINQPRLAKAYVEGLGTGVVDGVMGVVNMVVHPIETAQGMYRLVVNFDETKAGLKEKVRAYVEAASSDPEKFARLTGELVGQIEVALIGPKVIGGPKEVLGAIRTARNVIPRGRTLWHYTDDLGAARITGSSRIGAAGAAEVFASPLHPMLGASNSLMGVFARAVFLGGRLDFVRKVGQLLPRVRIKAAFTQAVGFRGGQFRHIFFTEVETALARAAKSVFPQYAATGPQQVRIVAQAIFSRPEALHALLDGAGMLGTASNVLIGNVEVPFRDVITATIDYYSDLLMKAADGHEEREDRSPGERLRRGGRDEELEDALDEPGMPLEYSVRNRLEAFLGADLSAVRVHTGVAAERLASAMGAEAFTLGTKIFLGQGANLATPEGFGTLVHEATHAVQAERGLTSGPATPTRTRALEVEAYAAERAFHQGGRPSLAGSGAPRALAAPVFRAERPAPPQLIVRETPAREDVPAPESAPAPSRVLKKASGGGVAPNKDPIQRVMSTWRVADMSREEFLDECTERVRELMREEIEVDAQRGATNLAWSYDAPMS